MTDINLLEHQPIAWTPTPDVVERAQLTKFMRQVGVSTWDELYQFSIRDVEKFTEEVLKFLDIKFDPPYEKLLDTSDGIEFPRWFSRNADAPVRSGDRNADTPVRSEGEARTTAATFANEKGWHERGYLPHFDGVTTQFVTFRLGDSLPQSVLRRFKEQLDRDQLSDNSDEYREMVEDYLDKGIGSCILRDPQVAEILKAAIIYENDRSCKVYAWVIMPNHAHIVLKPFEGRSLSDIIKRIKGVSARKINELRGTNGKVWQPDYFDRFIRDGKHFAKTIAYVNANPVKAGLCSAPEEWTFGSASAASGGADKSVRVPTAGLNITRMCLDRWQTDEMKDQPAVIWEGEEGLSFEISYGSLLQRVNECTSGLKSFDFTKGDAIGIHMPMMLETIIALLAINRIGAIAVPVFSGYGVSAIESRLNAVGAKAIFTCDGFPRRSKLVSAIDTAVEATKNVPTIQNVFVANRSNSINHFRYPKTFVEWDDLMGIDFGFVEKTTAEDPLIILYTSGTTGKPKGIAHTHASFPIKAAQDMAFGMDVGRGTRICWHTDLGWMMGPWLIYGALINGATICLYDGAPDYPTGDRMWEFCARHKVEFLGISPTLVRSLAAQEERNADTPVRNEGRLGPKDPSETQQPQRSSTPSQEGPAIADKSVRVPPHERHDLSSLRAFGSTGEPWNPGPWWWLFKEVGNSKLPIINYSGGTEISGGILSGNFLLPQKPCSFPAPCPGMDVDIVDENGKSVGPNEVGELVIKQPWIGMARGFWQEKERYFETYWSRLKNIWVHGDWAMRDEDGHWFILGRSDDTLKVAGKRVGPAEVESILVSHPSVVEAAVIGVPDETKGTAMVAFCVLRSADTPVRMSAKHENEPAASGDADKSVRVPIIDELKSLVARDMGKPLAPSKIHFVSALPKTRNAKVMRRVLRAAYLGQDPGDLSSLENPQSVEEIQRSRE